MINPNILPLSAVLFPNITLPIAKENSNVRTNIVAVATTPTVYLAKYTVPLEKPLEYMFFIVCSLWSAHTNKAMNMLHIIVKLDELIAESIVLCPDRTTVFNPALLSASSLVSSAPKNDIAKITAVHM